MFDAGARPSEHMLGLLQKVPALCGADRQDRKTQEKHHLELKRVLDGLIFEVDATHTLCVKNPRSFEGLAVWKEDSRNRESNSKQVTSTVASWIRVSVGQAHRHTSTGFDPRIGRAL